MWMTGGAQFTDAPPLDVVGGTGLVFEHGVWKYPQQAVGGRFKVSSLQSAPVRLTGVMADFGASTAWTLSVVGIDGTGARPDNTSGEPYAAADAALFREGAIQVASGTDRYLALNLNSTANDKFVIVLPGQDVVLTTAAGVAPLARLTFGLCTDFY
jgi:hypothetical protein